MPSPTAARPKVDKPWPTTPDSKPLPRPPEDVKSGKIDHPTPIREKESAFIAAPAWEPSKIEDFGGYSEDKKQGSAKRFDIVDKEQRRISERHNKAPIDTPKTSSESIRSLPCSDERYNAASSPSGACEEANYAASTGSENNPFRRKNKRRPAQSETSMDLENGISKLGIEDLSTSKAQREARDRTRGSSRNASAEVSQSAPQLSWSAEHDAGNFPDFSRSYMHGLEELENGPEVEKDVYNFGNETTRQRKSLPAPAIVSPQNLHTNPGTSYSSKIDHHQLQHQFDHEDIANSRHIPFNKHHAPIFDAETNSTSSNTAQQQEEVERDQSEKPNPLTIASDSPRRPPPRLQTSEMYHIRQVRWHDPTSPSQSLRNSPVMVQNANGPCPLLALVNALVLSTPVNVPTALVETLSSRENITLGFLLDAVIDELISGRRANAAQHLPDVGEMYAFLLSLHTGMSVNPRFLMVKEQPASLIDAPIDDAAIVESLKQGTFDNSREMQMYSPFAIPLIHGWIPSRSHSAFASLTRVARTYEDAQNVLFQEEDLERKLQSQGLTPDEQTILADIANVKYFLDSTATQLTTYGLDSISETLAPGSISILFRNDHFSTLYKHPKTGQLFSLVTDMGYAGHEEVVWESLVDVSGEGSEFFAGDFRPVGGSVDESLEQQTTVDAEGWQTITHRPRKKAHSSQRSRQSRGRSASKASKQDATTSRTPPERPTSTEQEDHDLALAMQLQEEEEDRHRRDAAARRREDELSERYLSASDPVSGRRTFPGFGRGARGGGPVVPPRGRPGPSTSRSSARPPVARRQSSSEDAPPSYEQAAKGPAYHPPPDHPAHPNALPSPVPSPGLQHRPPPTGMRTRDRTSSSAYAEQAAQLDGRPPTLTPTRSGPIRRTGTEQSSRGGEEGKKGKDKDEKCVVM